MTMKKIVSVAAALLTVVSSACICPISASAARTTPDDLSAADIAYLHSKGVTDEMLERVRQNSNTRSGTQLNHYAWFVYCTVSPYPNNIYTNLEFYRKSAVTYYNCVKGPAGIQVGDDGIGGTDWPGWLRDDFHAYATNIGMVAAYQYTCADDYFWSVYPYSTNNAAGIITYTPILIGDIDEDDDVDVADWVALYQLQAGTPLPSITDTGRLASDIDCDGVLFSNTDSTLLGEYLAGSRNCFWP